MKKNILVIKIGGNDLSMQGYIPKLAAAIAKAQADFNCILVHGGGKAISDMMNQLDAQPKFVDGQRQTDETTLEIAEMVLSGQINKTLVLALLQAGVEAIGMSGVDRKLLQVEPWSGSMNRVGRITKVRSDILHELCANHVVPVISPISIGPAGKYNVNADHAAGAIAGAVGAEQAYFISNVPGVSIDEQMLRVISSHDIERFITEGKIFGGMIPKVNAAQAALHLGAQSVVITDLEGMSSGAGTRVSFDKEIKHE